MRKEINNTPIILAGGLLCLTALSGLVLSSSLASAEDTVDTVSITVPESCSMTGTISTGNEHTTSIANGLYQNNIGTTSINILCNDNNGYSIYAAGYTGNEIGGTDSNKLIGTNTNQTIVTGTATTAGNPDTSNWAMKLTASTGTYPTIIVGSNDDETVYEQGQEPAYSYYYN